MADITDLYRKLLQQANAPLPAPPRNFSVRNGVQILPGMFEAGQMIRVAATPFTDLCFPHCHDNIEISYLVSGEVQMGIEDRSITMLPGEFLVLDTNCEHCPRLINRDTLLLSINIRTSFFDEAFFKRFYRKDDITNFFAKSIYSGKNDRRYLYFKPSGSERVRECIDNILFEFYQPSVCSQELVEAYMMIFFAEMIRIRSISPQCTILREQTGQADLPQLSSIIDYMNANLDHVTRADLADNFGYSYSHVNSIIRNTTGSGFLQLRQTLRLQRMERLLVTTMLPIAEIANMVGFHNLTDCYKLFRRTYNTSPHTYRETYSETLSEVAPEALELPAAVGNLRYLANS